jgi:signal transduction histidine kinase/CheY-like chemotaxis protein
LIAGDLTRLRSAPVAALATLLLAVGFATGCGKQSNKKNSLLEISSVNKLANRTGGSNTTLGFRGIITYSDPDTHMVFLEDATGGIEVDAAGIPNLPKVNTLVEVHGIALQTSGFPLVVRPSIVFLGYGRAPAAIPARASDLASAAYVGRRVEVRGTVQSGAIDQNGLLRVRIRDGEQVITARVKNNSDVDREALLGALITLRGVADPVINTDGAIEDYRVWTDSANQIKIVRPRVPRSSIPLSTVAQARKDFSNTTPDPAHLRVWLHGNVMEDGLGGFEFRDATGSLPMKMAQGLLSFTGHDVSAWAFPRVLPEGLVLEDTELREMEHSETSGAARWQLPLRHASDIRSMQKTDAAKRLPIDLEATVTYASIPSGLLFVQDDSAGIYTDVFGPLPAGITAGWRVRVRGRTTGGEFAPGISHARLWHIGEAPLPRPIPMVGDALLSARMDSQWIQIEGVARSLEQSDGYVTLHLVNGTTRFTAYLDDWGKLPEYLLGARLRLTGVCGSSSNARRQFNGVEIYVQRPEQIRITRPGADPFQFPIRSVRGLLQFSPSEEPAGQVHLRGVVTMVTPSGSVFVRDSSGGLEVLPAKPINLALGDRVDFAGYPKATRLGAVLEDATLRKIRHGAQPTPQRTSVYQILDDNLDSELVELDGKLVSQIPTLGEVHLLLNSGGNYFTAKLDLKMPLHKPLEPGSELRVRGICVVSPPASTGENIPHGFELRLRTADDVTVLKAAPWWTAERAYRGVVVGTVLLAGTLVWVFVLRRKVRQQTATIEKKLQTEATLREVAQTANQTKSEFLANMSHEIRTPVNGILGYARLALESATEPQIREHLEIITQSASALVGIINAILDLSKIESGRLVLETIDFPLRQEVEAAVRFFEPEADRKDLNLRWEATPEVPAAVNGDPLRLRQILLNLIGNAMKFTTQGYVHVTVCVECASSEATTLRFTVADSGIGIPLDKQQEVFSAFMQADSSITRKHGGTGLGLTICSKLVSLAGGKIYLKSELNKGTEFTFTMSFGRAELREQKPAEPEALPTIPSGLSILVAEDNVINQKLIKALLERNGHRVDIAVNGLLAVRAASRTDHRYDVILMDVQMPECDGYQATREIRCLEEERGGWRTPIIALTAHAMEGDRRRCEEAGMDGYATKPVEMATLLREIASCLQREDDKRDQLVQ